ncbi:hypothetical protein V1T76_08520 [Roseibium sp. FZY0029]|uniref:hypothetical protein n=1 Tax=Roseibium sp. FZY0029 TaxID=3116647 RepID=UPI002EACD15B|nr:hypothetical protein [Roseibium sp. FZY0029]
MEQLLPAERELVESADPETDEWPVILTSPLELTLDEAKARAVRAVDRMAETTRASVASSYPGKIGTYTLKREAALAAAGGDAEAEALFAAEAAARGTTAADLAALVEVKASAWQSAAFAIDTASIVAKNAIEAAEDTDRVSAAVYELSIALAAAVAETK